MDILDKSLRKHGFNAAGLHGDMDQASRTETLERFKDGKINFLVASDVAARGLDIDDLPVVFNFDVPMHSEDYIHRIDVLAAPDAKDGHFRSQHRQTVSMWSRSKRFSEIRYLG